MGAGSRGSDKLGESLWQSQHRVKSFIRSGRNSMERSTTVLVSESQAYAALIDELVERLKKEYGDQLVSALLYGSFARGTTTEGSDIDIILVIEDRGRGRMWEHDRFVSFNLRFKNESKLYKSLHDPYRSPLFISPVIFTRQEAEQNHLLFLDVYEEGKILFDKGGFFARRMVEFGKRLKQLGSRRTACEDGTWYWELKPDLKFGEVFEL